MSFIINEPLPKDLLKWLNGVLNSTADYGHITAKTIAQDEYASASYSTIKNLLNGGVIKPRSLVTVNEIVNYAISKCDQVITDHNRLKSNIKQYQKQLTL